MAAGPSRSNGGEDVEDLLKKLKLSEEEREGVVLAKEERSNLPEVKWMAVARVLTGKGFSDESLKRTMLAAWNTAREVTFRPIGKNLFVVQALCLGDWKRITEDGPWLFRDCALMMEHYDGASPNPPIPNRVQVWIQIHRIPPLFRTEAILKQLAAKVGEVVKVEARVFSFGNGEFHRARIWLDAARPLMRFVTLSPEGFESMALQVKFEKMPKYCSYCGLMGHVDLECGSGEFAEEELQYGSWMLAPMETWHPDTPRVRGGFVFDKEGNRGARGQTDRGGRSTSRGRHAGGGRGMHGDSRGRGSEPVWREKDGQQQNNGARKRTSDDAGLEPAKANELTDTATSPLKKVNEDAAGGLERPIVQRQLYLEGPKEHDGQLMEVPPPPPQYVAPKDMKRQRRSATSSANGKALANKTAGSLGEHRRDQ
ncbi:hypothetical protein QYE76_004229 [Lolium multiflorum]|uniref:CCHC-type domain-containing protein n=1 Tax=Lolium multiflorum TaxID=4521 RepID=A0AAD8W173_LOLMU|nr:hypothetical protein QYE76_004229 [Lolium multiflorum]